LGNGSLIEGLEILSGKDKFGRASLDYLLDNNLTESKEAGVLALAADPELALDELNK